VTGTANVLEAARKTDSVRALVCVTTDKVYENREWYWSYREIDPIGGIDPYSASKAAAEIVARSYMTTLFHGGSPLAMATARGGNVIGGGDWSEDRIIPDLIRSLRSREPLVLRSPSATRPWQHVTELCFGYLLLALRLDQGWPERAQGGSVFRDAWNFGPDAANDVSVQNLVSRLLALMENTGFPVRTEPSSLHESRDLRLDNSKAKAALGWRPLLTFDETIEWTASWYRHYMGNPKSARQLTEQQLSAYQHIIQQRLGV
jgi:CDP-glucose 4,6-dehydratase